MLGALKGLGEASEPAKASSLRPTHEPPRSTGRGRLGWARAEGGLLAISPERLRVGRIDRCGCQWHQYRSWDAISRLY